MAKPRSRGSNPGQTLHKLEAFWPSASPARPPNPCVLRGFYRMLSPQTWLFKKMLNPWNSSPPSAAVAGPHFVWEHAPESLQKYSTPRVTPSGCSTPKVTPSGRSTPSVTIRVPVHRDSDRSLAAVLTEAWMLPREAASTGREYPEDPECPDPTVVCTSGPVRMDGCLHCQLAGRTVCGLQTMESLLLPCPIGHQGRCPPATGTEMGESKRGCTACPRPRSSYTCNGVHEGQGRAC